MGRLFKYLIWLLILAVIAFAVYAMLAELPPPTTQHSVDLPTPPAAGAQGNG